MKQITAIIIAFSIALTACSGREDPRSDDEITSYRDVPGITPEEIDAIDALRSGQNRIVYGNHLLTEAFEAPDGETVGLAKDFFHFIRDFFDIDFELCKQDGSGIDSAVNQLDAGKVDIAYGVANTPSAFKRYYMTQPIAGRRMSAFVRSDANVKRNMSDIAGLRVGLFEKRATREVIAQYYPNLSIETVDVQTLPAAVEMLRTGEIDLFMSGMEIDRFFAQYDFIKPLNFFTPLYVPTSVAVADDRYRPIISVLNKYLSSGGIKKLSELYENGRTEYLRARLNSSFTDEERRYVDSVKNGGGVSVGFMHDAYPASFYNRVERTYQGVAPEILAEVTKLTGIRFNDTVTNSGTALADIVRKLKDGDISMATHLIYSESRENDFLWSETPYMSSRYALISRIDFPALEKYQVYYHKVGVIDGSVHAEKFEKWFPDHKRVTAYATGAAALEALESGEQHLVMLAENMLWAMTNYYGRTGYKVNIAFNDNQDALLGYNINEELLRSVIDKAMILIDIESIRSYWISRSFDYSKEILRQRIQHMYIFIGAAILVLLMMAVMFGRNKKLSKKLRIESDKHKNAEARAAEASEEKSRFLANMSHEIRTPLNAIVGMSDLLSIENLSDRQRNYVKDICTASRSLLSIVNDILDISKIEAGKLELNPVSYDFHKFIDGFVSMFRFMARKKGLGFDYEEAVPELPKCVFGDDVRLRQILMNISANAVNYTVEGRVGFRAAVADGSLIFEVSDTGVGIRPEDIESIFSPFKRISADGSRTVQGTGLGLPISRKFVEMMGGRIEVESKYGEGSKFRVIIPQKLGDAKDIKSAGGETVKSKTRFKAPDAKILVVDDNAMNLKVAFRLLSLFGINADLVASGEEAIAAVLKTGYDIVFMDHMMPGMDGIEATAKIRGLGGIYEKLPIIALTANATRGVRDVFLSSGMDDYVSKPIEIGMLGEALKKWLPAEKIASDIGEAADRACAARPESSGALWDAAAKVRFLNAEVGKNRVAGIEDMYRETLELFCGRLPRDCEQLESLFGAGDLNGFAVLVHGMKSSLSTIGAMGLSQTASELETAAKEGGAKRCGEALPGFLADLRELGEQISGILRGADGAVRDRGKGDMADLTALTKSACDAADAYNGDAALAIVEELLSRDHGPAIDEILKKTRYALRNFDFAEAVELLKQIV